MSDQDIPPGGPVPPPPPPPPPGPGPVAPPVASGGSILLGLGIGLGTMAATVGLAWALSGALSLPQLLTDWVGSIAGILPFGMIIVGIVLSALPKTRRTGAGILLSYGILILVAGGLCVALLAGLSTGQ